MGTQKSGATAPANPSVSPVQSFAQQWNASGKPAGGADYAYQMSKATGAGRQAIDPSQATSPQDLRGAFNDMNRQGMGIEQASQTFLTPDQRAQMAMMRQGGTGLPGQPGNMGDGIPTGHPGGNPSAFGGTGPNTPGFNADAWHQSLVANAPQGNVPVGAAAVGGGVTPSGGVTTTPGFVPSSGGLVYSGSGQSSPGLISDPSVAPGSAPITDPSLTSAMLKRWDAGSGTVTNPTVSPPPITLSGGSGTTPSIPGGSPGVTGTGTTSGVKPGTTSPVATSGVPPPGFSNYFSAPPPGLSSGVAKAGLDAFIPGVGGSGLLNAVGGNQTTANQVINTMGAGAGAQNYDPQAISNATAFFSGVPMWAQTIAKQTYATPAAYAAAQGNTSIDPSVTWAQLTK